MPTKTLLASAVLLTALLWWLSRPVERPFQTQLAQTQLPQAQSAQAQSAQSQTTHASTVPANRNVPDEYPQPSLKSQSRDAAVSAYIENVRRDPEYDWKIPIRFYGKVIDESSAPVVGASVYLQWVNLQGTEGVGTANTTTDAEGNFLFEGAKGKALSVKITKTGYYDVSGRENQTSFEFANPAEAIFHEPSPTTPAIFLMRRKGTPEPLVVQSLKLRLSGQGATASVDLMTGRVLPVGGELQVTMWKPTITTEQVNTGKVFPYDWRLQVKVNGGGLVEHKEVFAFEAPESGYVADYDASLHATDGLSPDVTVNKQFFFYFGQPRRYGRLQLRTDGDRPTVAVDYWVNPTPGNRNLEYDPSAN